MPCLVVLLGLFFPRVALALLWIFTNYVEQGPFRNWIWPLLGLIFMPYTTLAAVWGINTQFGPLQIVALVIGVLIDVGAWGGSERERRRRYA
jgi:quinol-cytochrome oxidoreductase complex cytochrome b subunit